MIMQVFKDDFIQAANGEWLVKSAADQFNTFVKDTANSLVLSNWHDAFLQTTPPWIGGDVVVHYICAIFEELETIHA